MPICKNCGSQQPDGAAFCDECGAKLEQVVPAAPFAAAMPGSTPTIVAATCPVCGISVTPGEAFCDNCGAALGPGTPASPPPQVAAPAPSLPATAPAPMRAGPLTCTNCGAQLEPGSYFCDMCGASVSATVPETPPPAPVPTTPPISVPPSAPAPADPSLAPTSTPPPLPTQPSPFTPTPATIPYEQHPPAAPSFLPPQPSGVAIQGRLVVQGTNAAIPFPPGRTEVIVGREDPISNVFPDVDLTDHGGDEGGVSRRHARIFLQGSQTLVEDLNSTNYTYVNQQRLTPGQPHPLHDGDEVRFGRVKLNFYT
jgi:predicted amidophosphoribosyltransferase